EYAAFESSIIPQRLPAIRRMTAAELSLVATARAVRRMGAVEQLAAVFDVGTQITRAAQTIAEGGMPSAEIAALQEAAHTLSHAAEVGSHNIVPSAIGERT